MRRTANGPHGHICEALRMFSDRAEHWTGGEMRKLLFGLCGLLILSAAAYWAMGFQKTVSTETASGVPVLRGASAVAAGFGHTLVIKEDRSVYAWGWNNQGQLGDGTTEDRDAAIPVTGLADIVAIAAGDDHSLALAADGTLWAWGGNDYGQLGTLGSAKESRPIEVRSIGPVRAIAAGENFSVVLRRDGTVMSWGSDDRGQLGTGGRAAAGAPAVIAGLNDVIAVSAGGNYGAALREDGTVWTWGANDRGQLGNGTTADRPRPAPVEGLSGITAIACGYEHALAVRNDGTLLAWGANSSGQLGDGSTQDRRRPVVVQGAGDVAAVAAGHEHSAAVLKNGKVMGWGANLHYELLKPFRPTAVKAEPLPFLDGAVMITSGGYHLTTILGDGTVRSWGANSFGQLGNQRRAYARLPVQALVLNRRATVAKKQASPLAPAQKEESIVQCAGGMAHTLALRADGTVWAWGGNFRGELGDGTRRTIRPVPQSVPDIAEVIAVAAGNRYSLALREDGTVWAWGDNEMRQLGDGTKAQSRKEPVQVAGLSDITAIAAGGTFSIAAKRDGTVWMWGFALLTGGAGNAAAAPLAPVAVRELNNVSSFAVGSGHILALGADGLVRAYGRNEFGQLGDGTMLQRLGFVPVAGLSEVVAVGAGTKYSVALRKDGTVWMWGLIRMPTSQNYFAACNAAPTKVEAIGDVVAIAAGEDHALFLRKDGTVWGWGSGRQFQLGNKVAAWTDQPVPIFGLENVTKIFAGRNHSLALKKDGTLWSWGYNDCGQLGNGTQGAKEYGSKDLDKQYLAKQIPGPVRKFEATTALPPTPAADVREVASGGAHSLLRTADGTVWSWGDDTYRQLGNRIDRTVNGKALMARFHNEKPFAVTGMSDLSAISAGAYHSLALKNDGTVVEWGRSYDDAAYERGVEAMSMMERLGYDRSLSRDRNRPAKAMSSSVGDLTDVSAVSAGMGFSLALLRDGSVRSWGLNKQGQLGTGTTLDSRVPQPVAGLAGIVVVSAGDNYALALGSDGAVWAWGVIGYEAQGNGLKPQVATKPVRVAELVNVATVVAGFEPLALLHDGTVWTCWQRAGKGAKASGPGRIAELENVQAISANGYHVLALGANGRVTAVTSTWSLSKAGAFDIRRTIEPVEELEDAIALSAGGNHNVALRRDGSIWVWGNNDFGQLGDATKIDSQAPLLLRLD